MSIIKTDGSSPYTLSDYEEFNLTSVNQKVEFDGVITSDLTSPDGFRLYVNDTLIASAVYYSSGRNSATVNVNKGDYVRTTNPSAIKTYARWYKWR